LLTWQQLAVEERAEKRREVRGLEMIPLSPLTGRPTFSTSPGQGVIRGACTVP
jgi:hypothetical protein